MTEFNAPTMPPGFNTTWEAFGYSGAGDVHALIGAHKGRPAVVAGSASGVWYELDYVIRKFGSNALYFGVNDTGMYMPMLDHWVSLHGKNLEAWKAVRWLHGHAREDTFYHAYDPEHNADYHWHLLSPLFALSGYFAMQIAWIMGCAPIVLVGCPGGKLPRFYEFNPRVEFAYGEPIENAMVEGVRIQLINEMDRLPEFKDVVRSQSGWTRDFFGHI